MVVASDMDPRARRLGGIQLPGGRRRGPVERGRLPRRVHARFASPPSPSTRSCSRATWTGRTTRAAGPPATVGTSSPSRSPSPTPPRRSTCAESTVRELAAEQALDLGEIDLLVATASVPGFADALAPRLGVPAEPGRRRLRTVSVGAHTAAPALALDPAASQTSGTRCSSPRGRGSRSPPRSTGHEPAQRARRRDGGQAAGAASGPGERHAPHPCRPPARAPPAGEDSWPASPAASPARGPPNIFTTLGQHPRLFRAWLWYSAHLMPFGQLPRADTELVILRVAWQCRSAYEWHQHVPLGLRMGLTADQIAGVAEDDAGRPLHGPSADAAGRQRRVARPAAALGRDVERRAGRSRSPRDARAVPAHRPLPGLGLHDRRAGNPSRTRRGRVEGELKTRCPRTTS